MPSGAGSSKIDDPRRAKAVHKFKFTRPPKSELPFDIYAFFGLWFALGAVLLQQRVYTWLNLLCLLGSLANMRFSQLDPTLLFSQVLMTALTFFATHGPVGEPVAIFPNLSAIVRKIVS